MILFMAGIIDLQKLSFLWNKTTGSELLNSRNNKV